VLPGDASFASKGAEVVLSKALSSLAGDDGAAILIETDNSPNPLL
jgi:hypothetical protein